MNKLLFIFFSTMAVIAIFGRYVTYTAETQPVEMSESVIHQRISAATPNMLNRSYKIIMSSMSVDERGQFLKVLADLMKTYGKDKVDADAAFRKHVDGMTVAAIMAEGKEIQESNN